MKSSIFRPIQLVLLGAITLVLLAMLMMSWLTWREQTRLTAARALLSETMAFHDQHMVVERTVIAIEPGGTWQPHERMIRQIEALEALASPADHETRTLLIELRSHLLKVTKPAERQHLLRAVELLRAIEESEERFEARLISDLYDASQAQLRYELGAPIVLFALVALAIPITRRRVMKPLERFGRQMSTLAQGDFTPNPEAETDPHTLPLHRNFIKLAVRLQDLERQQRKRAESLEEDVRSATEALLEQQQSLARAERLAVAGELAASVAHEIRNPLAGIQMSLINLRHEQEDAEVQERLDQVVTEVERLGRLVGEIVDAARHEPEPASRVVVGELVDQLVGLIRYQLPAPIEIECRGDRELACRVQKERLRQALLNLVLNSTKAIGNAPGRIAIEIERRERDLRICVSDDGPGFPEEILEGGVRPFYSTRSRGAGLGLAMVRRFVREVEGSMQLENGEGGGGRPGARVTLLLPSAVEDG